MQYILYLSILIYLFLTNSVAAQIGISTVTTFSSALLVLVLFTEFSKKYTLYFTATYKQEFRIFFLALFIIIWKILLDQPDQVKNVIDFFIIPISISILLSHQNIKNRKVIFYIVLLFFSVECVIAIAEAVMKINFLKDINADAESLNVFEDKSETGFRSTALLGHPLHNALGVSTIMGFILTTTLNNAKKLMLVFLGFTALLCFNARGAVVLWLLILVIYITAQLVSKKVKANHKMFLLIMITSSAIFISLLIVNYGFGDRLLTGNIYDGNAKTRTDVFNAFNYISNQDLWYGNAKNYTYVMKMLGAGGVENSYVVIIIQHGIILSVLIFMFYYFFIARKLKNYSLLNKTIIFVSFILVGSTNNSLAGVMPWGIFVICVSVCTLEGVLAKNSVKYKFKKPLHNATLISQCRL